jgi:menaquinone-9 beta-reductase
MPTPFASGYDVVIAGARVAGAATAMLLARQGLRVLVVDPLPHGRDTLSTHALMRGGVLQLHRWGLLDSIRVADTPAVTTTTFDYGDETIAIPIKPRDGIDALFAPRRTLLDPVLVQAATDAGAQVAHGHAVIDVERGRDGRVTGVRIVDAHRTARTVRADIVIGADGLRSRVARLVNAPTEYAATHSAACLYGYWPNLDMNEYRWSFRPGVSTGFIPTNGGQACVFVALPADRFARVRQDGLHPVYVESLRAVDPALADLVTRTPGSSLRAFAGAPGFLRRSTGPGWALVGDAGYFRDPITAHGISDALRDAELLARAIMSGDASSLARYQTERDAIARDLIDVSDRIASFDWSMDEVRDLHQAFSRAMNVGVERIREWSLTGEAPPNADGMRDLAAISAR